MTNKILITTLAFFVFGFRLNAQALLEANGPGNTYELINSVFAPTGGDVVENAECVHPEFGRHIAEVWDADLGKYVFEFYIHVTPDNDRCINFDRQRVEIKTYDASPANLKGTSGETVVYKWRFKVPAGFQPSSSFTHIHQVKAVGGDDDDPLFVLTARKGSPNKLELNYYSNSSLSSEKFTQVNLSLFENTWVEATERIRVDSINGSYSIVIKKVSDGSVILSYSNDKLLTIRADNTFIRPKWGIYRSLNTPADLRDETLRFNSFSVTEEPNTSTVENPVSNTQKIMTDYSNGKLHLNYTVTEDSDLTMEIFNTNGIQQLKPAKAVMISAGEHNDTFDITNLISGIYITRIQLGNCVQTSKLVIR